MDIYIQLHSLWFDHVKLEDKYIIALCSSLFFYFLRERENVSLAIFKATLFRQRFKTNNLTKIRPTFYGSKLWTSAFN